MFVKQYLNKTRSDFNDFKAIYDFVHLHTVEEIIGMCITDILYKKQKMEKERYNVPECIEVAKKVGINCFISPYIGGATVYDFIIDLKENLEEYAHFYDILADSKSKDTLLGIIQYRLFLNEEDLKRIQDTSSQYFLPALLPKTEETVFVDCGAFDGKTTKDYIKVYGSYKRIYMYEPSPDNYQTCCDEMTGFSDIVIRNKGVSDKKGFLNFTSHFPNTANRLNPLGDTKVDVTALDIDIEEKITFLKMDIEGAEQAALEGAKQHIKKDKPHLAICLYHTIQDLWKIPKQIHQYHTGYRFFIRYHDPGSLIPEEIVLYGVIPSAQSNDMQNGQTFEKQVLELFNTVYEAAHYIEDELDSDTANLELCKIVIADLSELLSGIVTGILGSPLCQSNRIESIFVVASEYLILSKTLLEEGDFNRAWQTFNIRFLAMLDYLYNEIYTQYINKASDF